MDEKLKYLLLKTVQDDNILPLTSVCNMSCLFCSHRYNPPGLEVYRTGHLALEFVRELIEFLSPGEPVIIGESATRIIEGEPLLHPEFKKIMILLRQRWPDKHIQLTTNGSLLTEEIIGLLHELKPLELNISVNCSNPEERVFLMRDQQSAEVFKGLKRLNKKKLKFNGSIVAMPHLLGWDYLEDTLNLLAEFQPDTVRIFMPGFTKYADKDLEFKSGIFYNRLEELVKGMVQRHEFPVLLEPAIVDDLSCQIKGIIPHTPAAESPLNRGDVILKVNKKRPSTRVECFQLISAADTPELEILKGNNETVSLSLRKKSNEKSGIVMNYDLAPGQFDELKSIVANYRSKGSKETVLIITSLFGVKLLRHLAGKLQQLNSGIKIKVLPVKSRYFGGTIGSAGLLTNDDILKEIALQNGLKPELIILPGIIYDIFGNDLTGKNYKIISEKINCDVKMIY